MFGRKPADLLIEIGTEELPPKSLQQLMKAFAANVEALLTESRLEFDEVIAVASPRRLSAIAVKTARRQPDRTVEKKGPPVKVAFDDAGAPTPAATAFAEKCGVGIDKLSRAKTDKGEWLVFSALEKGRKSHELVPEIVAQAVRDLPIARRMRWGSSDTEFVRPVHWLVMMHGKDLIEGSVLGVQSGNVTRGHRFMAPGDIRISEASKYLAELEAEGFVVADFAARRQKVVNGVKSAAKDAGGNAVASDDLYDEVTALTEWPVAMTGQFDAAFLALPREVITATLSGHQRYFPVEDKQGNLLPVFAVVANLESKEPGKVRAGNERVVAPRLADAAFFWETDRQTPLSERQEGLQNVVYQKGLGSIADKSVRISRLAMVVCSQLGVESDDAERAATLSKCDLQTGMVGEFPELQGTIGSYYAQEDGEPIEVCLAIGEQYLPRFAGDELPEGAAGQAVAIADRLDTIAGILALGRKPTGNSDPFGLRRAALGVVRIIIERGLELDLPALIAVALNQQPVKGAEAPALADEMYEFIIDRMRSWYLDRRSVTPQMFEAVRVRRPPSLADFDQRLVAVSAFVRLDAADSLAAANKRIANILRKAETKGKLRLDPKKLSEDAESALHDAMLSASDSIAPLMRKRAYADALTQLAKLRDPVDKFFDDVMVMTDDKALRQNRLALLSDLRDLFLDIADISRLSISKD
jgi:glycyl-tRNA synthetase beta chain